MKTYNKPLLICFSHLRWNFVFQRPQHLMTNFANEYLVIYVEEAIFVEQSRPTLQINKFNDSVKILTPTLPQNILIQELECTQRALLEEFIFTNNYVVSVLWYYSPMFINWTQNLPHQITVYDCMDELSAFKNAPTELKNYELELFK